MNSKTGKSRLTKSSSLKNTPQQALVKQTIGIYGSGCLPGTEEYCNKTFGINVSTLRPIKTTLSYIVGTSIGTLKNHIGAYYIIGGISILPDDSPLSTNPDNTVHYEAQFRQPLEPDEFVRRIRRFNKEQLAKIQKK